MITNSSLFIYLFFIFYDHIFLFLFFLHNFNLPFESENKISIFATRRRRRKNRGRRENWYDDWELVWKKKRGNEEEKKKLPYLVHTVLETQRYPTVTSKAAECGVTVVFTDSVSHTYPVIVKAIRMQQAHTRFQLSTPGRNRRNENVAFSLLLLLFLLFFRHTAYYSSVLRVLFIFSLRILILLKHLLII